MSFYCATVLLVSAGPQHNTCSYTTEYRTDHDRERDRGQVGRPGKAPGEPQGAASADRVPRRLLRSSLQLAQLLAGALGDLRVSLELRRLHKVLAVAAVPLVETLLRHPHAPGATISLHAWCLGCDGL